MRQSSESAPRPAAAMRHRPGPAPAPPGPRQAPPHSHRPPSLSLSFLSGPRRGPAQAPPNPRPLDCDATSAQPAAWALRDGHSEAPPLERRGPALDLAPPPQGRCYVRTARRTLAGASVTGRAEAPPHGCTRPRPFGYGTATAPRVAPSS